MKVGNLFTEFFRSERAGGLVLVACTFFSLLMTNIFPGYHDVWNIDVADHTLTHWINDGLMAIFFLLVGLELKRELFIGELSSAKKASLPGFAALGGMLLPAAIYAVVNPSPPALRGFGIPMATDIAFAVGILSLLGNRVSLSLKIFLTALAVIDDLGAILVIAIFYTAGISWMHLGIALGIFFILLAMNRMNVQRLLPYVTGGVAMWYFMLHSGIHATIAGVMLAFIIPFSSGNKSSASSRLQHALHNPVAFFILPLFALANTSIFIHGDFYIALGSGVSIGIMAGLIIGKPLGILSFSYLAVKLRWSALSEGIRWSEILGAGILGGIGFTMSIFISLLAFTDAERIDQSKIAVICGSLVAGIAGYFFLKRILKTA